MFEGKMLRVATGMPIRNIDFANILFALAEPEPFTFAKRMTKSLYVVMPRNYRAVGCE